MASDTEDIAEAELDPEAGGEDSSPPAELARGAGVEDSSPAPELDPETLARRDAALRHVRKLGDPVLRATAVPVDRFDEGLRLEIQQMGELMHDALGIGLAATQIGVLHRVLVYRTDAEHDITALVNPVLEWSSEETETAAEGCLSLPDVHIEVERPVRVRVRALDASGADVLIEAEELEARVIQHEIDHLNGVLILDRVSRSVRKEAMRAMREAARGEGSQGEAQQGEGSQGRKPQDKGPQGEGQQGEWPQGEGQQGEGPQGEGPQGEGQQDEGPQGEGQREASVA